MLFPHTSIQILLEGNARLAARETQSIVSAIKAMAEGMGLKMIAEGVETTGQIDFLREKKCQEVQGYLLSRPLSTQQAEAFLWQSYKLPSLGGHF